VAFELGEEAFSVLGVVAADEIPWGVRWLTG
jgi:hypothetical protein